MEILTYISIPNSIGISESGTGGYYAQFADGTTRVVTESEIIAAKRLKRVSEINAERDRREQGTFPYMSKQVQCDPISVQRISVAAATAQMALAANVAYSVDWSCADNSILTLDALGVLGMMQALGTHGIAIHYYARTLKDQVAVSNDPESIDILTGWPS